MNIDFNEIKKYFNDKYYDLGYIDKRDIKFLSNAPIKLHSIDIQETEDFSYGIVFVKKTINYDYSMFNEILEILNKNFKKMSFYFWEHINLKNSVVLSGLGQYGKNQLVYSYKFGFDIHIAVVLIKDIIINLPERKKANWNFLPQCKDCNDCYNACPVKAIHNKEKPYWVDIYACDNFCHYGNDKNIPSIKWSWGKYIVNPPIDDSILYQIKNFFDCKKLTGLEIKRSYLIDGKEKYIQFPTCRECASQPKCSKYDGKYPYDKNKYIIY